MDQSKYDTLLMNILNEEESIPSFLDVILGFLNRRTDLFIIQTEDNPNFGYPPGQCEQMIFDKVKYFQNISAGDTPRGIETEVEIESECTSIDESSADKSTQINSSVSNCKMESECFTECTPMSDNITETGQNNTIRSPESSADKSTQINGSVNNCKIQPELGCSNRITPQLTPDTSKRCSQSSSSNCYNGADRGNYAWAQKISDVDVEVRVGENIIKSAHLKVTITSKHITILANNEVIVDGDLAYGIKTDETVWTLSPGRYILIHLEKSKEVWWDQLLTCEPKINLRDIESTRPFSELSQEEQMKLNEVIWNDHQKSKGLPTSEQIKATNILRKSWDVEGSPFKGRPFDPSIINTN